MSTCNKFNSVGYFLYSKLKFDVYHVSHLCLWEANDLRSSLSPFLLKLSCKLEAEKCSKVVMSTLQKMYQKKLEDFVVQTQFIPKYWKRSSPFLLANWSKCRFGAYRQIKMWRYDSFVLLTKREWENSNQGKDGKVGREETELWWPENQPP